MGIALIIVFVLLLPVAAFFAVVGAIACGIIGGKRNIGAAKSAGAGAAFGWFVFPLVLLVSRMFNRSIPQPLFWLIYFLAYVIWLGFIAVVIGEMWWFWGYREGAGSYREIPTGNLLLISAALVSVIAVSVFTLLRSLRGIYELNREDRSLPAPGPFPSFHYLKPFIYASLWLFIGGLAVAYSTSAIAVANGIDIQGF